jgi:NADPH-dependent 2,4-dienoyl-CoA reductase/sulfur reductase-like enzyme
VVGKFVDDPMRLVKRTPEVFRRKQDIDVRTEHEVLELDVSGRRVLVRDLKNSRETWEAFDQVVIATGSRAIRPQVPGIDATGVFGVQTLEEGLRLLRMLDEERPAKAVIVGGGYIGIEMAEAMLNRGCQVSLIDMLPQVMGTLDSDMAELVSVRLEQAGVAVYLGEEMEGFETSDGAVCAVRTDGRALPADVVILGIGVVPNTRVAKGAGLSLGIMESIEVDERLETGIDGVWAVGDCAETFHLVSRRPFWVALATVSNKQGRVAGINIGGGQARFPGIVGTAATKFMDLEIARTGLMGRELAPLGLDFVSDVVDYRVRAGYYPGSGPIRVKLYAERGSGRLLGGQIVGAEGAAKRIDVIAAALQAGMSVGDLIDLDLAYAPPFSSAWDPIQIAARQVARKI